MKIAGVTASAFLLFRRKKKYFFDFSNCDKCVKTRNSNESHPGIYFRIGVSPHDKNKFIHNSKRIKS